MIKYTSTSLVSLASRNWMSDNGFDDESINHQTKVSGNNIDSWVTSLSSAGMTLDDYADYIAEILGW